MRKRNQDKATYKSPCRPYIVSVDLGEECDAVVRAIIALPRTDCSGPLRLTTSDVVRSAILLLGEAVGIHYDRELRRVQTQEE